MWLYLYVDWKFSHLSSLLNRQIIFLENWFDQLSISLWLIVWWWKALVRLFVHFGYFYAYVRIFTWFFSLFTIWIHFHCLWFCIHVRFFSLVNVSICVATLDRISDFVSLVPLFVFFCLVLFCFNYFNVCRVRLWVCVFLECCVLFFSIPNFF